MSGLCTGENYLLYAPGWNVSGRSSGEDYLLYVPGWNVSGPSSGKDYVLYARGRMCLVVRRVKVIFCMPHGGM